MFSVWCLEMKDFTELEVWRKARELAKTIYKVTESFPEKERYRLTDQLCRASVSISSNIAEGIGRNTSRDKMKFMFIARGSAFEAETQLYIASDLNYLNPGELESTLQELAIVKKLINGFVNYLNTKN